MAWTYPQTGASLGRGQFLLQTRATDTDGTPVRDVTFKYAKNSSAGTPGTFVAIFTDTSPNVDGLYTALWDNKSLVSGSYTLRVILTDTISTPYKPHFTTTDIVVIIQ